MGSFFASKKNVCFWLLALAIVVGLLPLVLLLSFFDSLKRNILLFGLTGEKRALVQRIFYLKKDLGLLKPEKESFISIGFGLASMFLVISDKYQEKRLSILGELEKRADAFKIAPWRFKAI